VRVSDVRRCESDLTRSMGRDLRCRIVARVGEVARDAALCLTGVWRVGATPTLSAKFNQLKRPGFVGGQLV